MPRVDFEDLAVGPAPQLGPEIFAARRKVAAAGLDDEVLLVATNPETTYSNDVHHLFRPHSDFWYLTGFCEPACLLVLDSSGTSTLFLRPREPKAEIWAGRRLGVERALVLGVDRAYSMGELAERLPSLLAGRPVQAIVDHHPELAAKISSITSWAKGSLAGQRCIKDRHEIAMLQRANDVGIAALEHALPLARSGGHEYQLEAELLHQYRKAGSTGPGYPPIVGAGANAAILHYVDNRAPISKGDLVLVDAGCEWGYYNSDITRTVPADGQWSSMQRELYDLVAQAQAAALSKVKPGNRLLDPHEAAVAVISQGLEDRGWLVDGDHRQFFMHGTSHFLGLDVHDVGAFKDSEGESRLLEPGMCITVEPGLYFNPDFATCPPGTQGIGIRIENDVLVTDDGHKDLTAALPTDADDIAALAGG